MSKAAHSPVANRSDKVEISSRQRASLKMLLPAALLFASGGAALIYQVLWVKQLSLVVGVEVYAVTTGISAFFAGLALGGLYFGRRADRLQDPVRLYAWLELAVALLGVGATLALSHVAEPFARLEASLGLLAWVLPFVLVGLPAVLMGGTLPVLVRALTPASDRVASAGGSLYAANTAGAILGTLLTAFLLLPQLGVHGSAFAAATLNLLAALGAWLWCRKERTPLPLAPPQDSPSPRARVAVALYCVAGGIALGYEVVWSQSIVQFMSTRTFAFAVVLATYLTGLMLGSALYARRAERIQNPWGLFGLLITAAGLLALLQVAGLGRWLVMAQSQMELWTLQVTGNELAGMCARFLTVALSTVFLPTTLLGAAFPLALRLAATSSQIGRDVGTLVALNTLGGIAGVALTGFLLIPSLGLVRTLALLAVLAALLGCIATWQSPTPRRYLAGATFAMTLMTLLLGALTPPERLAELLPGARNGHLAYYHEGKGGTVAVVTQGQGDRRFQRLYIQGVSNTGDAMPSLRYMRLQALLPLLIHGQRPDSALVIGFGTGITAGAMLRDPGLTRPVVAELLPEVLEAVPLFKGNYDAVHDPRLDIRLRDGRRELLRSDEQYDLITLEPPPPSAAGVVNLYSRDFYQLAARRLHRGGMVAQWLPLPTQNSEESRSLVRSFVEVFPHATLWTTEFHEMLLIGSLDPLALDVPRIRERFAEPAVAAALAEVGIDTPAALLATWVTDREGLLRFAGDALPVTDDWPRIEYAPWVRRNEITRVLPELLALRSPPPLRQADAAFRGEVERQWQSLDHFYSVAFYAYLGDRDAWARGVGQMTSEERANPYYRWFIGH